MAAYLGQSTTAIQTLSDGARILRETSPQMKGKDVKHVQQSLLSLGYELPKYGADGIYGPETRMAVTAFQEDNGLSVTGTVGPKTWSAISNAAPSAGLKTTGITTIKSNYWDPLSTTEKIMYGGGVTALILGLGIAINNRN
jgi:peptidoglycan hydrolase-like protein with peptidoglycan-binding domain